MPVILQGRRHSHEVLPRSTRMLRAHEIHRPLGPDALCAHGIAAASTRRTPPFWRTRWRLISRNHLWHGCAPRDACAVAALYHDASEILTGDMPTPVKYKREPLRRSLQGAGARTRQPSLPRLRPHRGCAAALDGYLTGDVADGKRAPASESGRQALRAHQVHGGREHAGNREFAGAQSPADGGAGTPWQCPEADIFPGAYAALLCLDTGRAEPRSERFRRRSGLRRKPGGLHGHSACFPAMHG